MLASKNMRWAFLALLGVAFFLAPFSSANAIPAGPPNTPTAESKENVSVGLSHTCVVRVDGSLWCTGDNKAGQLGDGTTTTKFSYVRVGLLNNWFDVSAGSAHTCAVNTSGQLFCWGSNANGQLGLGSTARSLTPARVGSLSGWSSTSAGSNHTCAINGGRAYCWGANANGQLGRGNTTSSNVPVLVSGGITNWVQVATDPGSNHTCAINNAGGSSTGALYCWGVNTNGQLGINSLVSKTAPNRIGTASDWKDVATGATHSCAIRSASNLTYCWGSNATGQLGIGSTVSKQAPTLVTGAAGSVDIDAGSGRTCATNGSGVKCWGNGTTSPTTLTFAAPDGSAIPLSNMVEVGGSHECGITTGRLALWCRGSNASGQLGTGNTTSAPSPIFIGRVSQTLSTETLPTPQYTDLTFSLDGVVTTDSDLDSVITYAVAPSETDCSVAGTTVTINAAGECSLVASQAGDGLYLPAPLDFAVTVSTSVLTVTISPADRTYSPVLPDGREATATCYVMGNRDGDDVGCTASDVLYATNNAGVRSATSTITLTGTSASNYTAAATATGTGTINRANISGFTALTNTADGVTVTYAPAGATTVALTTSGQLGGGTITYSTLDADCSIAGSTLTVDQRGDGSCVVTATIAQSANYNGTSDTVTVSIDKANQDTLTVTGGATVTYGATLDLDTDGGSGTGDVTFAVADGTADCSINPTTGELTVDDANGGATTCTVTATKALNGNYNVTTSADFVVTVNRATDSITINPSLDDTALVFNNTRALSLSVGGAGTGAITWGIGGSSTAVCGLTGEEDPDTLTITDANFGDTTCVVTATKAEDSNYNSTTATITIDIDRADQAAD
ncbi:MAG: hypothetical protein NTV27_00290, partial [Chloroflexi bacterium]|nr:hypothetical protein [Chloroflexota bacterium]